MTHGFTCDLCAERRLGRTHTVEVLHLGANLGARHVCEDCLELLSNPAGGHHRGERVTST